MSSSFPAVTVICASLLATTLAAPLVAQRVDQLAGKNVSIAQTTFNGRSAVRLIAAPDALNGDSYVIKARLYVHGAEQPVLIVNDLKLEPRQGQVALWVGPGTEGYFANLKITAR